MKRKERILNLIRANGFRTVWNILVIMYCIGVLISILILMLSAIYIIFLLALNLIYFLSSVVLSFISFKKPNEVNFYKKYLLLALIVGDILLFYRSERSKTRQKGIEFALFFIFSVCSICLITFIEVLVTFSFKLLLFIGFFGIFFGSFLVLIPIFYGNPETFLIRLKLAVAETPRVSFFGELLGANNLDNY